MFVYIIGSIDTSLLIVLLSCCPVDLLSYYLTTEPLLYAMALSCILRRRHRVRARCL